MPSKRRNGTASDSLAVQTAVPFEGFPRNRYTQVPDLLFDQLLAELTNDELRILLYVIRRTEGFKRDTDHISLSQFVSGITKANGQVLDRGTGLSRAAAARGIKGLVVRGILIVQHRQDGRGGHLPTTFRIHFDDDSYSPSVDHPYLASGLPQCIPETSLVHRRELQETHQETDGQQGYLQTEERQDDSELVQLWERCKVELACQMSKPNYDTWFRETRLVAYDGQRAVIAAPNPFTKEWLETRCLPLVRKTFQSVMERRVECSFVVERLESRAR